MLPYDTAAPLLGMYLEELKTGTLMDICLLGFMAAVFMICNGWRWSKGTLTDKGKGEMWCMHTVEH